jgi:effector-binding domain-containing protein
LEKREKSINGPIELKEIKPQTIASIRLEAKVRQISTLFPKLLKEILVYLEESDIQLIGAPLALFYNWKKGKGEIEVGVPVIKPITSNERIKASETPGGKVAHVLYIGKLRKIGPVYKMMKQWTEVNGYTLSNVWWENYLTDPQVEPDQNKWKTEINLLLKPSM